MMLFWVAVNGGWSGQFMHDLDLYYRQAWDLNLRSGAHNLEGAAGADALTLYAQALSGAPPGPVLPAWVTHYWTRDSLSALGAGDPVSTWADEIGAVALAQATPTRRPLYQPNAGDGYVQLDGIDDYLDAAVSSAQPNTILLVISDDLVFAGSRVFFDGVTAREHVYQSVGAMNIFAGTVRATALVPRTDNHVVGGVFNGASSMLVQGSTRVVPASPGTSALNLLRVGANNTGAAASVGAFRIRAVILALGYAPTTGDLDDLQTYCNTKYGALP